jgi:fructose-1-phosphate kinase PfkB-like protein
MVIRLYGKNNKYIETDIEERDIEKNSIIVQEVTRRCFTFNLTTDRWEETESYWFFPSRRVA